MADATTPSVTLAPRVVSASECQAMMRELRLAAALIDTHGIWPSGAKWKEDKCGLSGAQLQMIYLALLAAQDLLDAILDATASRAELEKF